MKEILKKIFYIVFAPLIVLGAIGWALSTFFASVGQALSRRKKKRSSVDVEA